MVQCSRTLMLMAVLGSVIGCSEDTGGIEFGVTSGVVMHNGGPVANARIMAFPDNGPLAVGATDSSGKFTFNTGNHKGVAVGRIRVSVATVETEAEPAEADATPIATSSSDPQSAGGNLAAMVKVAESQKKKKKSKKPDSPLAKYTDPSTSGLFYTIKSGQNDLNVDLK